MKLKVKNAEKMGMHHSCKNGDVIEVTDDGYAYRPTDRKLQHYHIMKVWTPVCAELVSEPVEIDWNQIYQGVGPFVP